jgi:anti-sigma regulatory factor (Ser/Thr protein kinase)
MPLRIGVGMSAAFTHYEAGQAPPDLGPPTAKLTLASDVNAPSAARQAVRDLCRGCERLFIADAELVVTELVTNAVAYGRGDEVVVSLWRGATTIDGRVWDGGSGFTPRPRAPDRQVGGRGLEVVDTVADSWGSSGCAPSSVWFRMTMPTIALTD